MKNIFLITKREYITQVKKKSFIVLTLLAPLLLAAFGAFMAYMVSGNHGEFHFNVQDNSGIFAGKLKSHDNIFYNYGVSGSKADGVIIIPKTNAQDLSSVGRNIQLISEKTVSDDAQETVSKDLTLVLRAEKIKMLNLDSNIITTIEEPVKITNITQNHKEDDQVYAVKSALSMLLMYATFMFIMIYGVRVMRSVLEEKNNRVVELIISSVKPYELMFGKIFGVTLVALTQFAAWIIMSVLAANFLNSGNAGSGFGMMDSTLKMLAGSAHILLQMNYLLIIFVFILYFILGYFFYSSLYAAIGSAVDNDTETQQFTMFAVIPLMIAMYGSFAVIKNPESPLAFWLSVVPLTSPVTMVARIPFGVPSWQLILSICVLIFSVLAMVFVAAKIYRIGILSYGNKASLREIVKWVKQ